MPTTPTHEPSPDTAPTDLSDAEVRALLEEYAEAYTAQKDHESLADELKRKCATLAQQLEPAFAHNKTLAIEDFQVTRSVPESVRYDAETAAAENAVIKAMLAPFASVSYDVKKAIEERPALEPMLFPYRTVTLGKPTFRATLKKAR